MRLWRNAQPVGHGCDGLVVEGGSRARRSVAYVQVWVPLSPSIQLPARGRLCWTLRSRRVVKIDFRCGRASLFSSIDGTGRGLTGQP